MDYWWKIDPHTGNKVPLPGKRIQAQCLDCYGFWEAEVFYYPYCPDCRKKRQVEMKQRLLLKYRA